MPQVILSYARRDLPTLQPLLQELRASGITIWRDQDSLLAKAYVALQDWPNAAASYSNVLQVYPNSEKAYSTASYLYHEVLFQFPEAFVLNQRWLERHPDNRSALSDFAEKHCTTGRFHECAQRIGVLVKRPVVEVSTKIALRAIEIANLLALGNTTQVPDKLQTMIDSLAAQLTILRLPGRSAALSTL